MESSQQENFSPLVIGLAGPSGSGKSLLAESLRKILGPSRCCLISLDCYYRDLSQLSPAERTGVDFDHPGALEVEQIVEDLQSLRQGKTIACPVYDFTTHTRTVLSAAVQSAPLILVEGVFTLALPALQPLLDRRWYLDLPADACLARRLQRDVTERGRDEGEVRRRFEQFVRPALARWVEPQKMTAQRVFQGSLPIPTVVGEALANLPPTLAQPPHQSVASHLSGLFRPLAARLGPEALAARLNRQASHWSGLQHQGEGLLRVERWLPLDQIVKTALRWTGLAAWGRRGAARLQVTENRVCFPHLPPDLEGLTILHLSDLHLDLETGVLEALHAALPSLCYDLAVITGDFRNSTAGDFGESVRLTGGLVKLLHQPVLGIPGNHDFIEMVPGLEASGLRLLLNEGVFFQRGRSRLFIAGIDDPHFYRSHDLARAGLLPPSPDTLRILLSHSPEIYREAAPHFDLMLSGHTHGGQICLPGGIPIIRNGNCPDRLIAGRWQHGTLQGYTSRGTGCCGVAARFFCPPEITLHRLVRAGVG